MYHSKQGIQVMKFLKNKNVHNAHHSHMYSYTIK